MKTKTFSIIAFVILMPVFALAQLKVDQYGRVGIGTNWPNSEFKCHIAGNLLLTSYPSNPFYELRMKVNYGPVGGITIGSSSKAISFWSDYVSFNDLFAANYFKLSDSTYKSNVISLNSGLEKVMRLNPVYYTINDNRINQKGDKISGIRNEYGFIAQEVERQFPEAKFTDEALGNLLLDYDQIIPLTVSAIQEQQKTILMLQKQIEELKVTLNKSVNKSFSAQNENTIEDISISKLFQNRPNPFSEQTIIAYEIGQSEFQSALILVYDINGKLIIQHPVLENGIGEFLIGRKELQPGIYIYSLLVNQQEVDTKRMILLK